MCPADRLLLRVLTPELITQVPQYYREGGRMMGVLGIRSMFLEGKFASISKKMEKLQLEILSLSEISW